MEHYRLVLHLAQEVVLYRSAAKEHVLPTMGLEFPVEQVVDLKTVLKLLGHNLIC